MILGLVFLALAGAVGVGTWVYLRRVESGGSKPRSGAPNPKAVEMFRSGGKDNTIPETWRIEHIEKGIIRLPGNRFRVVCRVEAPDYYLLGVEGQDAVEDAVAAALRQLSFPVQTVVTSVSADTAREVDVLRSRVGELSPALAELALERAAYLEARGRDRTDAVRQAYLVVGWDAGKDVPISEAWGEMMARVASLGDALAGARIRLEPLDSAGVTDLLAHFLRRGSPLRPSEAAAAGVMELYSVNWKEAG